VPSRSKKNQAARLRRKRFWEEVFEAGAYMGTDKLRQFYDWVAALEAEEAA
jgi:hypothetical protein